MAKMTREQKVKYLVGVVRRHGSIVLMVAPRKGSDADGQPYAGYITYGPRKRRIARSRFQWRSLVVGEDYYNHYRKPCYLDFEEVKTLRQRFTKMLKHDWTHSLGPITVYKGKKKLRVL